MQGKRNVCGGCRGYLDDLPKVCFHFFLWMAWPAHVDLRQILIRRMLLQKGWCSS